MLGSFPDSVGGRSIIVSGRKERKESQAASQLLSKRPLSPQRVTVEVGEKNVPGTWEMNSSRKAAVDGNNRKVEK